MTFVSAVLAFVAALVVSACDAGAPYGADVEIALRPKVETSAFRELVATRLRSLGIASNVEAQPDGSVLVVADARGLDAIQKLLVWDGALAFTASPHGAAGAPRKRARVPREAVVQTTLTLQGRAALIELTDDARAAIAEVALGGDDPLSVELAGGVIGRATPPLSNGAPLIISFGDDIRAFSRASEVLKLLRAPRIPEAQIDAVRVVPKAAFRTVAVVLFPLVISFGWLFFVRRFDRVKPEPAFVVAGTFILGLASALPAWLVELVLGRLSPWLDPAVMTLGGQPLGLPLGLVAYTLFVGVVEEGSKLLSVLAFARRRSEFDEPIDGIVYATAASLGFAAIENAHLFAVGSLSSGLLALRALMTVPAHMFFSAIWGYALGAKLVSRRARLLPAFALSALAHGAFDATVSADPLRPIAVAECIVLGLVFTEAVRRHLREPDIQAKGAKDAMYSQRPRAIVPLGDRRRSRLHALALAILFGLLATFATTFDHGAHYASARSLAVCLGVFAVMTLALVRFAEEVPLDAVLDSTGVTWSGHLVEWREVKQTKEVSRAGRTWLSLETSAGEVALGPASPEQLATLVKQVSIWSRR